MEENIYIRAILTVVEQICERRPQEPVLSRAVGELRLFSEGKQARDFSFSLVLRRNRDLQWVRFTLEGDALTAEEGGFCYEAAQFGDIYGDWYFTVWQDGQTAGSLQLDQKKILSMLEDGAEIET